MLLCATHGHLDILHPSWPLPLHRPCNFRQPTLSPCLLNAAYFVHRLFAPVSFRFSHVRQSIDIVELHVLFFDCEIQALVRLFRFSVRITQKPHPSPSHQASLVSFQVKKAYRSSYPYVTRNIRPWHNSSSNSHQTSVLRIQYMRKILPSNLKHSRHALTTQCRVPKKQPPPPPQASDQHAVEAGYPLMQRTLVPLATLCENCSMNRFMQLVPSPPTSLRQQQFLFANLVEQEPIMTIEGRQIARYELEWWLWLRRIMV